MKFACKEHPNHQGVGVCAFCVREKLLLCIRSLNKTDGKDERNASSDKASTPSTSRDNEKEVSSSIKGTRDTDGAKHKRGISDLQYYGSNSVCDRSKEEGSKQHGHGRNKFYYSPRSSASASTALERQEDPISLLSTKCLLDSTHEVSSKSADTNQENFSFVSVPASPTMFPRASSKFVSVHRPSLSVDTGHVCPRSLFPSHALSSLSSIHPRASEPRNFPCDLRSPQGQRPIVASSMSSRISTTHSEQVCQRSGQWSISTKREPIWTSVLRKLQHLRAKRVAEKDQQDNGLISCRPSSASYFDFHRHSSSSRPGGSVDFNDLQAPTPTLPRSSGREAVKSAQRDCNRKGVSDGEWVLRRFSEATSSDNLQDLTSSPPGSTRMEAVKFIQRDWNRRRGDGDEWVSWYASTNPLYQSTTRADLHSWHYRNKSASSLQKQQPRENGKLLRFYLTPTGFCSSMAP